MFLEINDKNKSDIVVYSQNIFDPDENFRIIYNDGLKKRHKKISYSDVCGLINYPAQKNLIVYRLLTNYEKIDAADSKYGVVVTVDNKDELIYFDPVFALKDLNNLVKNFNLQSFRFKIQQLGIKTLTYLNEKESFTEIFSYDLHAIEAQNQNDKIFADALYPENIELRGNSSDKTFAETKSEIETNSSEEKDNQSINEVSWERENPLAKADTKNLPQKPANKYEQKELLKRILGIEESIERMPHDKGTENRSEENELIDHDTCSELFKSASKKKTLEERGKDSVVLKLTIS